MPVMLLHAPSNGFKRLERVMNIAAKSGFDGIEVDASGQGLKVNRLFLLSVDKELPVKSVIAPRFKLFSPWSFLTESETDFFDAVQEIKPDNVALYVPRMPLIRGLGSEFFKQKVEEFQQKFGRRSVSIENSPPLKGIRPIMGIKKLRDFAYENDVYVNFDISNCAAIGRDILMGYDMLAARIRNVHLSDFGGLKGCDHLLPGKGLLPIGVLLSRLKHNDYKGMITLEINPRELRGNDESDTITLFRELIGFVKSYF